MKKVTVSMYVPNGQDIKKGTSKLFGTVYHVTRAAIGTALINAGKAVLDNKGKKKENDKTGGKNEQ